MSLPKQVQVLADEAERIQQEIQAQNSPPPADPAEPPQDPPAGTTEDPPALEPAPLSDPTAPPPVPTDDTWERRFKSLKGKYDAEVPRLSSEVQVLRDQVAALSKPQPKQPEPARTATPLVTDKDVEAFGGDLIDLMKRQATEVAESRMAEAVARLEAENRTLAEKLDGVNARQGTNDRQRYFESLAHLVPDYEAVNLDEDFMAWLRETDELSGLPRQAYLNKAFESFDVQHTAKLFNAFKAGTQPTPAAPTHRSPPRELARQVAPGTSKASPATPHANEPRIMTTREIEGFYADVRRGVYRGNEVEQARIEAEIDAAVAAGRIR